MFLGWSQVAHILIIAILHTHHVKEDKKISFHTIWIQKVICSYLAVANLFVMSLPLQYNIWRVWYPYVRYLRPELTDWLCWRQVNAGSGDSWPELRRRRHPQPEDRRSTGAPRDWGDINGQPNIPIINARKTVAAGVMTRWIVVGKWQPRLLREGDTSKEVLAWRARLNSRADRRK